MELYSENENYKLYQGNMLHMLQEIEKESIDSIVCDPPYELNFMNKGWDNSGIAFVPYTWKQCYEVLKPGGYLLAFGGSRTFHRIAVAIEDAGFEIRDTIMWLYGSGFPKSMNIGKAIESKLQNGSANKKDFKNLEGTKVESGNWGISKMSAKQWDSWGTALKPAFEPIIVARKPFKGSLVDNVIKYGVGGINIDECRVGNEHFEQKNGSYDNNENQSCFGNIKRTPKEYNGRFPANTILTYDDTDFEEVCGGFPNTKSKGSKANYEKGNQDNTTHLYTNIKSGVHFEDSGSAARYFMNCKYNGKDEEIELEQKRYIYQPKASKKDRDEGLEEFEEKKTGELQGGRKEGSAGSIMLNTDGTTRVNPYAGTGTPKKNSHPTVKPTTLMQYLVRLVTPKDGTVLDPFNGSGSTGKAVMYENKERQAGYKYIGIELTEEYLPIAQARIEYVCNLPEKEKEENNQITFEELIK